MAQTTRTDAMEDVASIRSEAMEGYYRLKKQREKGLTTAQSLQAEHSENEKLAITLKAAITEIAQDNLVISQGNLEQRVKQIDMQKKKMEKK